MVSSTSLTMYLISTNYLMEFWWAGAVETPYNRDEDWVFASPEKLGQQPYWPHSALRKAVRPAAVRAGIVKHIGWHTFRHSFATLLKANGEDVKVVQETLSREQQNHAGCLHARLDAD